VQGTSRLHGSDQELSHSDFCNQPPYLPLSSESIFASMRHEMSTPLLHHSSSHHNYLLTTHDLTIDLRSYPFFNVFWEGSN